MRFTLFTPTMSIYTFFSVFGIFSAVTAVAIPNPAPVAVYGTGITPGMYNRIIQTFYRGEGCD